MAAKWTLVADEIRWDGVKVATVAPEAERESNLRDTLRLALCQLNEVERDRRYGLTTASATHLL